MRFVLLFHKTTDQFIYKEKKFTWLTVLEARKFKTERPYLVKTFVLHHSMAEGRRAREHKIAREDRIGFLNPLLR